MGEAFGAGLVGGSERLGAGVPLRLCEPLVNVAGRHEPEAGVVICLDFWVIRWFDVSRPLGH